MSRTRALRRGNWSVQELERLRQLLPRRGVDAMAMLLRRSPASIAKKAAALLRVPARRGDWTDSDDALLREAWGAVEPRLLATMLGRPTADVRRRAATLRAHARSGVWSRAERQLLRDLYPTRRDEDLEVCLSRSRADVVRMAAELCLAKDKRFAARLTDRSGGKRGAQVVRGVRMPRWSDDEVERLRVVYADRDNLEVARLIGRSVTSVANKANQLGLRKSATLLTDLGRHNVALRGRVRQPDAADAGAAGAAGA